MTHAVRRIGGSRRLPLRVLAVAALLAAAGCTPTDDIARIGGFAQGTTYGAQWAATPGVAPDAVEAALEAELARLDELLSNYRPDSAIERFNAARSTTVQDVPAELVALLGAARTVHRASGGCFDPTVRELVALWGFDGAEPAVPDPAALEAALERIGIDNVEIVGDAQLGKRTPAAEVDVSGIAQGYSADRLAAALESFGLERYLVEIGGEIVARGRKPDGEPWRVAIETPDGAGGAVRRVLTLPERRAAIATSGTYEHFFVADGVRYSHVLDPRTGWPVSHALISATVLHAEGALADAWSTALVCLGPERAMETAAREDLAVVLFVERDGSLVEWMSPAALAIAP